MAGIFVLPPSPKGGLFNSLSNFDLLRGASLITILHSPPLGDGGKKQS